MNDYQDEISLRELYLIFKGGLGWIVGVSIVVAALAFVVKIAQPHTYETSANVQVSPLQLTKAAGSTLDLSSVTQVDFETYKAIATSQPVLAATLKAVPSAPKDLTPQALSAKVSISQVGKGTPLVVNQAVTLTDGKLAAQIANAWAKASADAVRASVSKNVQDVASKLSGQQAALLDALNSAESKWAAFQKMDDRSTLQAQLSSLDNETTSAQAKVLSLDRNIASAKAEQQMLESIVQARQQGNPADVQTQLQALADGGVLSNSQRSALANAVSSLPDGAGLASQDVATVVARAQLQQSAQNLAGYVAERQTLQTQLQAFGQQATDLRSKLADLNQQANDLQRALNQATSSYNDIAQAAPTTDAIAKLVPAMVNVLNTASVPIKPQPRHTVVTTAVALVLAFFVMVLFVFLRAAVSPESEPGGRGGSTPGPGGVGTSGSASTEEVHAGGAPAGARDSSS